MSKARRDVLLTPNSVDAVARLIEAEISNLKNSTAAAIATRWPQRYLRMVRVPSDSCLRSLLRAVDELDMPSITAIDGYDVAKAPNLVGAIGALHVAHSRRRPGPESGQFDSAAPLRERIVQASRPQPSVSRLSHYAAVLDLRTSIMHTLASAGVTDRSVELALETHRFIRSARQSVYGGRTRVLTSSWTVAIGHIAMLAHHVYAMRQGLTDYKEMKIWKGPVGNQALLDLVCGVAGDITVVPPFPSVSENHLSIVPEYMDGEFLDHFSACERILALRPPPQGRLFAPPAEYRHAVQDLLRSAGLPPNRPFVTVHVRENRRESADFAAFRNADINLMRPAIDRLVNDGVSVIRLGDRSMTPLTGIDGVFDYALSGKNSPELDIALAAHSHFHIGTSSGMSLVPMLFGVPTLFLNWYPIHLMPYGARNHVILKGLRDLKTGAYATSAVDYRKTGISRDANVLAANGVELFDLEEAHITAAVDRFARAVADGLHQATLHGQPRVFAPADNSSFIELNRADLRIA